MGHEAMQKNDVKDMVLLVRVDDMHFTNARSAQQL
jgi:hypothetical protein